MDMKKCIVIFFWYSCLFVYTEGTMRCMSCTNIPLPRVCETVVTCAANEECFIEKVSVAGHTLYNTGCKPITECMNPAVVGRRDVSVRANNPIECCRTNYCNKEGFGLTDIPLALRGPYCFSGSYGVDVTQTNHVTTCQKGEVCTTVTESFAGSSDTFYTQKCTARTACPTIHQFTSCDGSCCERDFCNDRCEHYSTPAPTMSYNDQLRDECLKHINEGYFYDSYSNLCALIVKSNNLYHWNEAAHACKATNGDLMSINSQDEQDFLLSWIFSHQANDTDFWIGARAYVTKSHNYYWPDGGSASDLNVFKHWSGVMMGQPDDRRTKNENCVFLNNKDRYFWHDDECSALKTGYVCEIWNVTGDKVPLCRRHVFDGFFYDSDNDMCLKLLESRLPQFRQTTAEFECKKYGATLAIIDNEKKMDFVLKWIFSNHENATDFWIGAQDIHNNSEFYWPNGQKVSYAHWGNPVFPPELHGQPDAAYGVTNQRCVYIDYINNYFWFDEVCTAPKSGFICQFNGADHDSTKTECRRRLTQGYFYDDFTNMCISLKTRQNSNYQQAHDACAAENTQLVTVDSQDKMDFILSWIFFQKANDTDYWIAGNDPQGNNNFVWEPSGKTFTYTHWYTVAATPAEDCAILDHIDVYRWKPANCASRVHGYICQINQHTLATTLPTTPTTPTTTTTTTTKPPTTPTTTPKVCPHKAGDILFILDSSGSEGDTVFANTKSLAASVARLLFINSYDVKFAGLVFSTAVKPMFRFDSNTDQLAVIVAIQSMPYTPGSSHTESALFYARNYSLTTQQGVRNNSEKIVIVFTDGASNVPSATTLQAKALHAVAHVIAVGVGGSAAQHTNELYNIASSPNLVLNPTADIIYRAIADILKATC